METQESKPAKKSKKWLRNIIIILVVGLGAFFYVKFYFVWGTGVKTGQLNYVVHKGYVFKTYEGKLIQAGLKSTGQSGTIQSNEFEFSVDNKEVAEKLMLAGGQEVDLHYKQYLGALPWRGYSKYVVDSIISMKPRPSGLDY